MRQMPGLMILAFALSACAGGPVGNRDVPEPAKAVELSRYLGLWHEFARYENRFEKGCEGVTAEYALRSDGLISVRNTCRQGAPDGPVEVANGRARPTGDAKGAKLKVSFFGPFYVGDYQVLDRAEDYSWAIVGDRSGRFLWILTRAAQPSAAQRQTLLNRAREMGYDLKLLRLTEQLPGPAA
jgi:apolipoprotein D and lipocalin family protein